MSLSKQSKMLNYINYRMRVTIQDTRTLVGTFLAFDKHMNLVLGDCEEYRPIKIKGGAASQEGLPEFAKADRFQRRSLGLVLLRGEQVISLTVEGPPPSKGNRSRIAGVGPGVGRMAGRGIVPGMGAPHGLAGPIQGLGGPTGNMMMPLGGLPMAPIGRGRGMPPGGFGPPR